MIPGCEELQSRGLVDAIGVVLDQQCHIPVCSDSVIGDGVGSAMEDMLEGQDSGMEFVVAKELLCQDFLHY